MARKKKIRHAGRKTRQASTIMVKLFQVLVVAVALVFAVFFMYNKGRRFLSHSDFFTVREVVKSPSLSFISSRFLQRLIGKNIFRVDLRDVQRDLQSRYPHIDELQVVRAFPNRLYLDARTRDPLAWFSVGEQAFFLDRKAVVLPAEKSPGAFPEISGLNQPRPLVVGKPLSGSRVRTALDIVGKIRSDSYLSSYAVKTVDVEHLSRIDVILESSGIPLVQNRFSVIMDRDHIGQKIKTLGILLSQGNLNPQEIKYIDLRFKEPILAKK